MSVICNPTAPAGGEYDTEHWPSDDPSALSTHPVAEKVPLASLSSQRTTPVGTDGVEVASTTVAVTVIEPPAATEAGLGETLV